MRAPLEQIASCPYSGPVRRLYLESRALELIALHLDQLSPETPSRDVPGPLRADEKERTDFAKDLLVRDLENTPGLVELARAAGMSHPRLNRCFRRMYGMTVFQYLRNERLNRARKMLEEEGLTVTEASFAVGYNSLSHFSQAYKRRFGRSPGRHARAR
jgi:AraC-like DNA-binding protein